jgi:ubiquinone/menaquinone biosynthesis C-methylase UbiE
MKNPPELPPQILAHYEAGREVERLLTGFGRLELARSQELLRRYLPPPPAVILDVGGGSGIYSLWLAELGYEVHLVDAVPLHVEQACQASQERREHPLASANLGDARKLDRAGSSVDGLLLFGPLYHLTTRAGRLQALSEAGRVLKPGGVLLAVAISRFASALAGLFEGHIEDPAFQEIVARDLEEGQHRNPGDHPLYFTNAYFHMPGELAQEIEAAGLEHLRTLAVEGPGWMLKDFDEHWADPVRRAGLLKLIAALEEEPSLIGASAHIMAIGRKGGDSL